MMEQKIIKQLDFVRRRLGVTMGVLKLFEIGPVFDAELMANVLNNYSQKSLYVVSMSQGLDLPRLNVRTLKKTLFFLTQKYVEGPLSSFLYDVAQYPGLFNKYVADKLPLNILVESTGKKEANYLIRHDYRMSQALVELKKVQSNVRFTPVSIRIPTPYGNVEPDIVTYTISSNKTIVIPVIFEIVNTIHNVNEYFPYLFLKYMDIAEASGSLAAHMIFATNQSLDVVARVFDSTFKDVRIKSVVKRRFAYILKALPLTVYLWNIEDVLRESAFVYTVQSGCDFILTTRQEINFEIPANQHIKRLTIDFNNVMNDI